ncbi:MAG: VTT domain-containing protein, partial [Candidatus Nanohaloarchaea archaeon]|nr:VTT domain-containing protein [Candidatus Nanohaloarchaea archaeon]
QTVFAPIPGHVTAAVGGYLFGTLYGSLYSSIGVLIGTTIGFSLARRYGRPAVEHMLSDEALAGFDGFVDEVGLPGLFLFVVIPGLPDDVLAVLGGLTTYRLPTFLAVMVIGRFPAFLLFSYAGHSVTEGKFLQTAVISGVIILISAAAYHWRDEMQQRLSNL